jgi:DNA-binding MarR family transcriptional regulator
MRDRLSYLLYRAAASATALADEALRAEGLTARAVGILTLIIERAPMTQRALGDILGIDRTTMVSLVDDLEAKGLAERKRHPADRRAFLVHPTGAGRAAQARALLRLDDCERRYMEPLSAQDRRLLAELLRRLEPRLARPSR